MQRKNSFAYTSEEIIATVKAKSGGGAYINVPSRWVGGQAKVMLLGTNTITADLVKYRRKPDKIGESVSGAY